jgi:biotin operon repressor
MTKAFKAKVQNPLRKLVLIKLADNANDKGVCHPSYQHIADQCEISRRSVIDHVKALQAMGVLTIKHRMNDGENTSNSFHICSKKLEELSSAVYSLGGEPAALGSANGAKKRAPDSLGGECAAPPLVQELHPEPSLSNHHLTINEPSLNHNAPATAVAMHLSSKILSVNPSAKLRPESWVKEIDRAIRLDGRTKQDLLNIIDWIYSPAGSFWQANIMSGAKLREKFDTMLMQSKADRSGFKAKPSSHTGFSTKNYSAGATQLDPDDWAARIGGSA